jgi:hypothetical protein
MCRVPLSLWARRRRSDAGLLHLYGRHSAWNEAPPLIAQEAPIGSAFYDRITTAEIPSLLHARNSRRPFSCAPRAARPRSAL